VRKVEKKNTVKNIINNTNKENKIPELNKKKKNTKSNSTTNPVFKQNNMNTNDNQIVVDENILNKIEIPEIKKKKTFGKKVSGK
jgi:hypothetical protein